MKTTNRDLDAALAVQLFGWRNVSDGYGIPEKEFPSRHGAQPVPAWTCEQIAVELRKIADRPSAILWGFMYGEGFAQIEWLKEPLDIVQSHCSDPSIPELDRPRHALGWLALELKGKA